jgi:hypothetical protein
MRAHTSPLSFQSATKRSRVRGASLLYVVATSSCWHVVSRGLTCMDTVNRLLLVERESEESTQCDDGNMWAASRGRAMLTDERWMRSIVLRGCWPCRWGGTWVTLPHESGNEDIVVLVRQDAPPRLHVHKDFLFEAPSHDRLRQIIICSAWRTVKSSVTSRTRRAFSHPIC